MADGRYPSIPSSLRSQIHRLKILFEMRLDAEGMNYAESIAQGYKIAERGIDALISALSAPEHSSLKHEAAAIKEAFAQRRIALEEIMASNKGDTKP